MTSIERKAISALKWATAAKVVVQTISWAGTLVVIRLLTPQDYGLMAKVAVVCGIAGAIAELGLGVAVVRWVDMAREDLRKIYGIALAFGACVTAFVALLSPLLSRLFQEPMLTWPIAVASLQIVIGATATIPNALATRELSFRHLAKIEMATGVSSVLVTVVLAALGAGVWALVSGTLLGAMVRSSALLAFGERVNPLFSWRGIGEQLKFGLTLVGNRVSYYAVVQSDVLIGSAFLTTTEIGQYAVALQLATLPMSKVMGIINEITLPTVARQQDDRAHVAQNLLRSLGVISLLAFPVLWGISAVAPELVATLFGPQWLPAVSALTILPLIVPIRMVCSIMFTTSLALGNRRLDLRNTVANFVLIPCGFYVGAHWGLIGLCLAWLVAVPLVYAISVPSVMRFIGIRPLELLAECGSPAAAASVMYAAIALTRTQLAGQSALVALVVLSLVGAAVYLGTVALVSRQHLVNAHRFARSLRSGDAPKVA